MLIGGLALSLTAQAEVVCNGCVFDYTKSIGTYLGAYWPGDKGTFKSQTVFTTPVSGFWVIDLNANGTLVFTASTPKAALTEHFRAELYSDLGSDCDWNPGGLCMGISLHYPEMIGCTYIEIGESACRMTSYTVLSSPDGVRRWTLKAPLVAGRYVLRVIGQKGATSFASYSGQVTLR